MIAAMLGDSVKLELPLSFLYVHASFKTLMRVNFLTTFIDLGTHFGINDYCAHGAHIIFVPVRLVIKIVY